MTFRQMLTVAAEQAGRRPPWLRLSGDNINRDTVANVQRVGFQVVAVDGFLGGLVKLIEARKGRQ